MTDLITKFYFACNHFLGKYNEEFINGKYDDLLFNENLVNIINVDFTKNMEYMINYYYSKKSYTSSITDINDDLLTLFKNNTIMYIHINKCISVPFIVYNSDNVICIIFFYANNYNESDKYYVPYKGFTIQKDDIILKNTLSNIIKIYYLCNMLTVMHDNIQTIQYSISHFISVYSDIDVFFNCNLIEIIQNESTFASMQLYDSNQYKFNEACNKINDTRYKSKKIGDVIKKINKFKANFSFTYVLEQIFNESYFTKNNNKFTLDKIRNINLSDFNIDKTKLNFVNDNVKNLLILHNLNNELYAPNIFSNTSNNIWFSFYWSFIFFSFMTTKNTKDYIDSYINEIIKINKHLIKYINEFINSPELPKLFSHDIVKYTNIVNLIYKFVHINVLDSSILEKLNTNINSVPDLINNQPVNISTAFILENELFNNLHGTFNKNKNHLYKLPYIYFSNKNKLYNATDQIIFLYKLYCYLSHNTIKYFVQVPYRQPKFPPQFLPPIPKKIHQIITKYHELCDLDSTKYYNYIPMYYFYAKWVYGYVKNQANDKTGISNIDLTIDNNMNGFCLFLHKYDLFMTCKNIIITGYSTLNEQNHAIDDQTVLYLNDIYGQFFDTSNINLNYIITDDITPNPIKNPLFDITYQINFCYPSALYLFYPTTNGCQQFHFKYDLFDLDMFKKTIDFFINNPHLMYNSPNNDVSELYQPEINLGHNMQYMGCQMLLKYLIYDITEEQKNKLIHYFYEQYENKHKYIKGKTVDHQYLNMIILLLNKDALYLEDIFGNQTYEMDKHVYSHWLLDTEYDLCSYIYFYPTDSNRYEFDNKLNNLSKHKIKKYIETIKENLRNKHKQIPTNSQVADEIIRNVNEYTADIDKYIKIIKTYFPHIIIYNKKLMLNNEEYSFIKFIGSANNYDIYSKYLNTPICSINNNKDTIYSFYDDFFLKFKYNSQMVITDIYIDDETIMTNAHSLPFFYLLPKNGIYFVYLKNNVYHIRYFIQDNRSLLITINPNNLFFPNPFNNISDYDTFMDLCIKYGITLYNYIYINIQNIKQHILNYITDIIPSFYLKHQLNGFDYIKINTNNVNENKYINVINKHVHDSSIALLNKIKKCDINHLFIEHFNQLKHNANGFTNGFIKNMPAHYKYGYSRLFENYDQLYRYLLYLKIKNACDSLINSAETNLCSQIKIFNERFALKSTRFNYLYEAFFEFYTGIELTEEQFNRYYQIISNYENWIKTPSYKLNNKKIKDKIDFSNIQTGGNFPLHHLMMGKGKSAVLTPLLTLYFTLKHNKNVYIIVPIHLVKQTESTIKPIASVFNISDKIIIKSEYEIKEMYLNKVFHDMPDDDKHKMIFLIDEFDYILDPLKSNYNVILDHKQQTDLNDMIHLIHHFINNYKQSINTGNFDIKKIVEMPLNKSYTNFYLYQNECTNIITQIKNNSLKKNINWGIHPTKCYAIPFMNKDKIMNDCNFTSYTLTIFLTLFNYIIEKDTVNLESLVDYIKINKLLNNSDIFRTKYDTDDQLKNDLNKNTNDCYINLINYIVRTLELPAKQLNTSFIDILNINHVYKIGYSGTLNIDLPIQQENVDQFTQNDIVRDNDERKNVIYAIKKSNIIVFTNAHKPKYQYNKQITELNEFFNETTLKSYDALIDEAGLFKNIKNIKIAEKLYNDTFNQTRPVIFLTETDDKMVLYNNSVAKYDPYLNLINPFIYYSQSHTIGVDINQDNYPTLKGLCIIDDHSKYTTIAQAIFRLRKLNMGHIVDFYHINWLTKNKPSDLIKQFDDKDNENKINKRPSLLYQTFKSLYRNILKNDGRSDFIKIHTEEIKYYYFGDYVKYLVPSGNTGISIQFGNYFSGILDGAYILMHEPKYNYLKNIMIELQSYNMGKRDIFSELIFNIATYGLQISKQIEKQIINEHLSTNHHQQETMSANQLFVANPYIRNKSVIIISLMFKHEILQKINHTNYKTYALQLNEYNNIYYLPNIFCNHSSFQYTENKSGIVCVFIDNSMLLIPFYCFMYFINYPIFNLQLKWICGKEMSSSEIEKIYTNFTPSNMKFFKIMNNSPDEWSDAPTKIKTMDLNENFNIELYIYYSQLIEKYSITEKHFKYLKKIKEIYDENREKFEKHIIGLIINDIKEQHSLETYSTYLVESINIIFNKKRNDIYYQINDPPKTGGSYMIPDLYNMHIKYNSKLK